MKDKFWTKHIIKVSSLQNSNDFVKIKVNNEIKN